MRKHVFTIGEYYHIYNRGVDKRDVLTDADDLKRFMQSCSAFNTTEPIGSIYEMSFKKALGSPTSKLVSILCYCINPNHYHLLLSPLVDKGVEKFMQRMGGYTKYFNEKYQRSGSLFQGKFKSKHVSDNTYLLHVSAYINMNNRDVLGSPTSKLSCSSYEVYSTNSSGSEIECDTTLIVEQFQDAAEYREFAHRSWKSTQELKAQSKNELIFLPESIAFN